jgi:hypothetical protein
MRPRRCQAIALSGERQSASSTFRTNQRFNLEVTRLQTTGDAGNGRLANVITGKVRQLAGDVSNALVIVARGLHLTEDSLIAAVRLLKMHTNRKSDSFFAPPRTQRRARLLRPIPPSRRHLRPGSGAHTPRAIFLPNREAVTMLMQCLTSAGGARESS